jgi:hypothetical protein
MVQLRHQIVVTGVLLPASDGEPPYRTHPTGLHRDHSRDKAELRNVQHSPLAVNPAAVSAFAIATSETNSKHDCQLVSTVDSSRPDLFC